MGKLCIIGFDDNKVIKDFIRIHVEKLEDDKICLNHWYPDYRHEGRTIRYFHSRHPLRAKLKKLLPHFIYHRLVTRHETSEAAVFDALASFFQHHDVDVILAEFGDAGAAICPCATQLGIPLVVHFHGHDAHRSFLLTDSLKARYRYMFENAYRILSVSRHMTDALVSLGCDPGKIVCNPYGPRESFFSVSADYRPTVLSVGRFTDIKANYLVLMAFRETLKHCPEARLVMVGEGELLETCRTLTQVWGIGKQVRFTGPVPSAEILPYFAKACCFAQHSVTPSYGDAEGTPNTILEACAAGLPVVATRHAGIVDAVVDGETGYLVDERDVEAMATSLTRLLTDPDLCRKMGRAGREHIRSHFHPDDHVARLQQLIDEARGSASHPN